MSEHAPAELVDGSKSSTGAPPEPGFLEEAADLWNRLPHKLLFAIVFVGWIVLFHFSGNATLGYTNSPSLFVWAVSVYRGDDAHGKFIPFAVLLFFWIKRKELSEIASQVWWPGALYFAFAVFLHFAAFRIQQSRISVFAFILGLHALIGLIWGREALRRTVFPVFLLLFCIPMGNLADRITFYLRILVTKISVGIGHDILGVQVYRDGSQIMGPHGRAMYDVAPACSGMRSLTAMAALSFIYAFLNLNVPWRRIVLILCALPLALFANIVRITTVIIVGEAFGQKYGAMIEQKFGFITFAIAIAGLMLLAKIIDGKEKDPIPKNAPVLEETTA
jgi:exosortase